MKKALLVIDIQEDTTGSPEPKKWHPFPISGSAQLIDTINSYISKAAVSGDEVIYITGVIPNNFLFRKFPGILLRGTPGSQVDHRIIIVNSHIFEKTSPSALSNKKLRAFIKEKGITHIELTGIDAAQCVAATAAEGLRLGLDVTIIDSATATTVPKKLPKVKEKLKQMGVKYI